MAKMSVDSVTNSKNWFYMKVCLLFANIGSVFIGAYIVLTINEGIKILREFEPNTQFNLDLIEEITFIVICLSVYLVFHCIQFIFGSYSLGNNSKVGLYASLLCFLPILTSTALITGKYFSCEFFFTTIIFQILHTSISFIMIRLLDDDTVICFS